jgi:tRNA threonylcarbamoyladenosine biosynthesis protein TsaB
MLTLALDASTYTGTVALLRGDAVIAEREAAMRGRDEERLMPAVAALLAEAGVTPGSLARVVCGAGPGSFTSLRIAASIAKGIASAHDLPLGAVSSLLLIVAGARPALPAGSYLAVLDAMRGERFVAEVSVGTDGGVGLVSRRLLVGAADVEAEAASRGARLIGPGQPLDVAPHARGVARLASAPEAVADVDLATWEPDYGRVAEAQAKWEAAHGRPLSSA